VYALVKVPLLVLVVLAASDTDIALFVQRARDTTPVRHRQIAGPLRPLIVRRARPMRGDMRTWNERIKAR